LIENRLRWSHDEVCWEDAVQVSSGHGPENLDILKKTALSLLWAVPRPRVKWKKQMSGPKKRLTAVMNPDYMFTVIFGKVNADALGYLPRSCLISQTNRTPGLMVEWKNEDHFTVEASHESMVLLIQRTVKRLRRKKCGEAGYRAFL
jgi:hypothetical protein